MRRFLTSEACELSVVLLSLAVFVYSMTYAVQVADQINARTNHVAFFGRAEIDGAPTLAEAYARLKLA